MKSEITGQMGVHSNGLQYEKKKKTSAQEYADYGKTVYGSSGGTYSSTGGTSD